MAKAIAKKAQRPSLLDNYVFMDKTLQVLDVGLKTGKNVVLYGPGGHGKSELSEEFLREKGFVPYIITMGSGMTADRLFGGIDLPLLDETGKIEYLVENSFMNHPFVILEEMMDAQDHLLEQLKDILSSGFFRNGTQIFEIKTQFIIANTNKTREEFAKNASLRALMERFPLEHNVIWDNYTETSYNTLLEKRFGTSEHTIDPIIPFLLQEYSRNNIIISPRIALDTYEVYMDCGPDSLIFIADFARKPALISEALKRFEATMRFKQIGAEVQELVSVLSTNDTETHEKRTDFIADFKQLFSKTSELKTMTVNDDMVTIHAQVRTKSEEAVSNFRGQYDLACIGKPASALQPNVADVVGSMNNSTEKKGRSKYDYGAKAVAQPPKPAPKRKEW